MAQPPLTLVQIFPTESYADLKAAAEGLISLADGWDMLMEEVRAGWPCWLPMNQGRPAA